MLTVRLNAPLAYVRNSKVYRANNARILEVYPLKATALFPRILSVTYFRDTWCTGMNPATLDSPTKPCMH